MADAVLFYALGGLLLVSAALVVTVKNIFHAALYLALALFVVAAIYVTLGAYFLAAIQVLVYIGAVVVLAIFVINLTRTVTGAPVTLSRRWVIPAALVSALTACLIAVALLKAADSSPASPPATADATAAIGRGLLGQWVLPFELVSVLLLSSLIASIAIVGKDREEER
ncbi:MAG TPA: NADH-quinone oxidoreductase subunit J [Spirochaetia bacterium]|nr:NADH-quinone oxidoreductase subunit J [Spirochaetia bacterium]